MVGRSPKAFEKYLSKCDLYSALDGNVYTLDGRTPMEVYPANYLTKNVPYFNQKFTFRAKGCVTINKPINLTHSKPENFPVTSENEINLYQPPKWFFVDIPQSEREFITHKSPQVQPYITLIKHLCEGDSPSVSAIIHWIALSIFDRDGFLPFLTLLGGKGIGKNTLFNVISEIHGLTNSAIVSNASFRSNYNNYLQSATLIFLDEFKFIRNDEKLKSLTNKKHDLTAKFLNSKTLDRVIRVMIASNDKSKIEISTDERRFLIPFLTKEPIFTSPEIVKNYGHFGAFEQALFNETNLAYFCAFLRDTALPNALLEDRVFISSRSEIFSANLNEWEDKFIDTLKNLSKEGCSTITLKEIQDIIQTALPHLKRPPGKTKISAFIESRYNNLIALKQNTKTGERYLTWGKEILND